MSGWSGPPPVPTNAWHANALYWQRNQPDRPPGYLTTKEATKALGFKEVRTVLAKARRGEMGRTKRVGAQWFFHEGDIADLALGRIIAGGKK